MLLTVDVDARCIGVDVDVEGDVVPGSVPFLMVGKITCSSFCVCGDRLVVIFAVDAR